MLTRLPLIFLFICCFCFFSARAQNIYADTVSAAANSVINQYKNRQGENLLLYNGIEYARAYPHTTGYPFLFSDSFPPGSLIYDGVIYENVPLNYDITSNCIVIKNNDNFLIELVTDKINSFVLNNHAFVSLSAADIPKEAMPPGIYEWYHYSSASVFIKHQKIVQRANNAADLDHFTEYNEIFVQKGENIFHIKNSKDLLTVFADQQNAVTSYLRQNHLKYKQHPEETVVKAVAYYAQLKK